jgi:hypothetical protein
MCDFKPGDEAEFIIPFTQLDYGDALVASPSGTFVCMEVGADADQCWNCQSFDWVRLDDGGDIVCPCVLTKVQRRKTDLSIERFLTIKPGFEEPKRSPAEKRPVRAMGEG